jgi:hypothetical protein
VTEPAGTGHLEEHGIEEAPSGTHTEHEDDAWTVNIPDHPKRADSPEYVQSRARMNALAHQAFNSPDGLAYGEPPWQDHHGGGLWLKDEHGWFLVRNLAGMEWSSQFAASPQKVDALRRNAQRLYALFPGAVAELGIGELLATPITDAAGVARWTDSICNASVPLSPGAHTGVLPKNGGVHHYPAPVTDIEVFVRDDFSLWVTDAEGNPAAVVPVAPRGSGDGRVIVLHAEKGSQLHAEHQRHREAGTPHVLDAAHGMARQAFARQQDAAPAA